MITKRMNFALISMLYLLGALPVSSSAFAQQSVIDTAFCKDVKDLECVDPIAANTSVDLSELRKDANGAVLYFWGSLRNPDRRVVAHYFARRGECYASVKTVGTDRARSANSSWRSFFNWARTRALGDLTSFLFKDVKVDAGVKAGIDVKISGAVAEPSERFRVFTFRNILCAGEIEARLIDSQGNPLTPDSSNDVKSLTITNALPR
jgi:hypothetical protein